MCGNFLIAVFHRPINRVGCDKYGNVKTFYQPTNVLTSIVSFYVLRESVFVSHPS